MCRKPILKTVVPLIAAVGLCAVYVGARSAEDGPDDDERAYQAAIAQRTLRENCLICHGQEMIATQRLTPAQWKAEVEKMIGWGAPVPKDQGQPLIDYLARQYSTKEPPARLARITYDEALREVRPEVPVPAPAAGDPRRGSALFTTHCASCHGSDGQGAELGPNLVEKPVLLRPRDFVAVIEQGRNRMPGFQKLLGRTEADDMLAWLRRRRFVPAPVR